MQRVAEIQVERPVPAQLGASTVARASVSPWMRAVNRFALPGHLIVNRERAVHVIAATIQRHRPGALDIT